MRNLGFATRIKLSQSDLKHSSFNSVAEPSIVWTSVGKQWKQDNDIFVTLSCFLCASLENVRNVIRQN